MYRSKTKRVAVYGRRATRVVTVLDKTPLAYTENSEQVQQHAESIDDDFPTTTSQLPVMSKIKRAPLKASAGATKKTKKATTQNPPLCGKGDKAERIRQPLESLHNNSPASPALPPRAFKPRTSLPRSRTRPKSTLKESVVPYIDSDLVDLTAEEHKVNGETMKKANVGSRKAIRALSKHRVETSSDSDDSDDEFIPVRRSQPKNPIVLSDSEPSDSSDDENELHVQERTSRRPPVSARKSTRKSNVGKMVVEVVIPRRKSIASSVIRSKRDSTYESPVHRKENPVGAGLRSRSRELTSNGRVIPSTMSPCQAKKTIETFEIDDSLSVDNDEEMRITAKVANLRLDDAKEPPKKQSGQLPKIQIRSQEPAIQPMRPPAYLRPILSECGQVTPFDFDAFLETLPTELLFTNIGNAFQQGNVPQVYTKVGEASYSEVFGYGNVVLKVIPLLNEETSPSETWSASWGSPQVSEVSDVVREINVTRAMGEVCKGFIKLIKAHVVQGRYPDRLLALWDEFEKNGSEGVRPDHFTPRQAYAVIVLPNGGPDLEAFSFSKTRDHEKFGWQQACSIFWQVARSLATAEELVHFEHRDLHWGQVLVRHSKNPAPFFPMSSNKMAPMDHPSHGVVATIIDLGLARIDQGSGKSFWTEFDEEIFEGEGDYQYDVYRMMRSCNGSRWETFQPLTNIMWLHYLVDRLLNHKKIRAPLRSRRSSVMESEENIRAYNCLKEVENVLGNTVYPIARKVGAKVSRRNSHLSSNAQLCSATAVISFGKQHGWIG